MTSQSETPTDGEQPNRIALVTGATRGIGRAVAIALAAEGLHVIITGRVTSALEETDDAIRAAGGTATLIPLNLQQTERIDALGPTLYQRFGRLDVLIANAGLLGPLSPLPHVTMDAWARVLELNLTVNWQLIRTLDPLLRRSDAGRAVFVTSGAAKAKNAYWGPYAVSKAGLEALAKTYAREMVNTNVRVNLINPGPIRTQMRAKAFPGEDPATLYTPEDIAPLFVELASPECTTNGEIFDGPGWLRQHVGTKSSA
ncbi:SDR family NAD(P)-dependent oxidoreductase [Filomicrobium sp.]|uniref:SDR family NAD(P)-dependent oxidoreductase n=1 Tax=Filomicrobium sp. TaxID=2024831 RepID=UPI0025897B5C|nr:SDR family NAD(P)-dependent oxidoreductase [Filomicrobium sp.]MCV0371517.1 SDR family NAD(P)-dependent oxidoreductase [Filomicrobium sp.]